MSKRYDLILKKEILPAINEALKQESGKYKRKLNKTIHSEFYQTEHPNIKSYIFTERVIQYIIVRELCNTYKILTEDRAYGKSQERLDISFYIDHDDPKLFADIGIEFKIVRFTREGVLYEKSLSNIIADFDKIKRIGNDHKYLLIQGVTTTKELDLKHLVDDIHSRISKRKIRYYKLVPISQESFKTDTDYYTSIILKVIPNDTP